jgi:hypothetical protein
VTLDHGEVADALLGMSLAASARSSSGATVTSSEVIRARTGVVAGSTPSATASTRSRSVTIPTSW